MGFSKVSRCHEDSTVIEGDSEVDGVYPELVNSNGLLLTEHVFVEALKSFFFEVFCDGTDVAFYA